MVSKGLVPSRVCFPMSYIQLGTVDTEVQTDSMLDSMWHPNAVIIGADVGPETDEHEYKSLTVPADKSRNPPPTRPCKHIGVESGYLPYILAFNIHLTVL